jgi:glycerophosphoryl diester phosphodiesterase
VDRAVALGADFVEVDVRRTADGRLVCLHDPAVARAEIATTGLADLAAACEAAGVPQPALFGDVVDRCRGRLRLAVECKVPGTEAQALDEAGRDAFPWTVFMSFNDQTVRALKRREPSCTTGLLVGRRLSRYFGLSRLGELFPAARILASGASFVSPNVRLLKLGFAARMRLAGWPVFPWTVNGAEALKAHLHDVDGLITDDVAMLVAMRNAEMQARQRAPIA